MERIVLDTNALIQCIPIRSKYHIIWNKILDGSYQLCVSNAILNEYEEIIERLVDVSTAKFVINVILNNPNTVFINPTFNFVLIVADPDDDKFVDVAVAGRARFIVSDDKHFNVLKNIQFPRVEVVRVDKLYSDIVNQNN